MIIDSHTHIGNSAGFTADGEVLLRDMDYNHIDFALVSSLSGCEYDSYTRPLTNTLNQIETNNETLQLIKKHPDRFRGLFWVKAHHEGWNSDIDKYISDHRDFFVGLKIHPYYSLLPVTDPKYEPYFETAKKFGLPVVVHTAEDDWSLSSHVAEASKRHPELSFVLVHLGLYTDHKESIEIVRSSDQLYGDLTWLSSNDTRYTVENLDSRKILFGTDAPIAGENTYSRYYEAISYIKNQPEYVRSNILFHNANDLFSLNLA